MFIYNPIHASRINDKGKIGILPATGGWNSGYSRVQVPNEAWLWSFGATVTEQHFHFFLTVKRLLYINI
jgi:hypothetical protein